MHTFPTLTFFDNAFFWLGPLTQSLKPVCSLTYSCCEAQHTSYSTTFLSLTLFLTFVINFTTAAALRYERVYDPMVLFLRWGAETSSKDWICSSLWHVWPRHPAVSMWVHRHTLRAERLLICAIDFLIGSASRLVNENMLCAGSKTLSSL